MGDGFINLSNIGWLIVLAIFYVGAVKIQGGESPIPPETVAKIKKFADKIEGFPLPYIAVGFWVVLRTLFALGWQLQLELLMVTGACSYVFRQLNRVKTRFHHDLQLQLTTADDPTQLLGKNLPEWVTYPSSNRVQWLNTMIAGMWPSIVGATEKSIRQTLEPLLDRMKPSFVYGFKLKSASIGNKPIVFNGIQNHVYGTNETTLDLACSWDAEMDFRLLVQVPGPDMEILINDFEMRMTLRVTMGPHIPQWPCFANMAISLVGKPDIDFDVTAAKISLDAVPGLGSFIDTFIRSTLVGMMAYPKGFAFPIVQGYKMDMGLGSGALGTLKLKFLRMENLLPKYASKYRKTPFYVKIVMIDEGKKRVRGQSYTGIDSLMQDVFSFTLYDNTGTLRVWLYFDVVGTDICVGICDIATEVLMQSELEENELIMAKPSDPSHRRRASLMVKADFLPFEGKGDGGGTAPPEGLPPRNVSPQFLEQLKDENFVPEVPRSRGGTPRASIGNSSSGTLFITVESASDLPNLERLSKSDPYVFLRIKGATAKSPYINNNLNPVFNFTAELPVVDCEKDVLKISFIDKNDVGKDKLMATLDVPITRVLATKAETLSGEFDLAPQGKARITLNFLRHG